MNTAALERIVSRAVYSAALLERALHDRGPWTMRWGPVETVATRTVHPGGVSFEATFPEVCWIARVDPSVTLLCRGEVAAVRAVDHPGDTAFAVTWDFAAAVAARAH